MLSLIQNKLFYVNNSVTYPPFKCGYYMEEYFLNYMINNKLKYDKNGRLYIPILWTNFQIESWFQNVKNEMQQILDKYINENHCENGYFTVVQYDDGPLLKLPANTIIYGACSGNIPLPLIYEDNKNTLFNILSNNKKPFNEKSILCSFVGTNTHKLRKNMANILCNSEYFKIYIKNTWSTDINVDLQQLFIDNTLNSKFALAPRGYGRSSFRFFEIFQLGAIPIYIWDDIEWLPYKDKIDYSKICISISECDIEKLESILLNIDENQYNTMKNEYEKIKYIFELEYICKYVLENE